SLGCGHVHPGPKDGGANTGAPCGGGTGLWGPLHGAEAGGLPHGPGCCAGPGWGGYAPAGGGGVRCPGAQNGPGGDTGGTYGRPWVIDVAGNAGAWAGAKRGAPGWRRSEERRVGKEWRTRGSGQG